MASISTVRKLAAALEVDPPELPSGRALLAYLLREGRSVKERPVVVAKEAAICELLLTRPTKGEGNK